MRILFLQKVDNAKGGVTNVNTNLMTYFLSLQYDVELISLRHGPSWEEVTYPQGVHIQLVNDKEVWGGPRLREVLGQVTSGHIFRAISMLKDRVIYDRKMKKDYAQCKKVIRELQPDVIINSHYELLDAIDSSYLKKTIMHFHTSFDQVIENRSYVKTFQKYASRIHKFVWLTEKTRDEAIDFGFKNSISIYNPLSFSESRQADMKNKKMIFIGRLSEEKRVDLAIRYFEEVVRENALDDWVFEIYGSGELTEEIVKGIINKQQVIYKGTTDCVNEVLLESSLLVLTSRFEGMPLVAAEANECGVPVIVYDFGESSREVVLDGRTGVIVPQNDEERFKEVLTIFFKDEKYRQKLSAECKTFAKTFALENIGSQWERLFKEMEQ